VSINGTKTYLQLDRDINTWIFIDFIEIAFLVVPILTPIAMALDIDFIWFGILITMNLQTSLNSIICI